MTNYDAAILFIVTVAIYLGKNWWEARETRREIKRLRQTKWLLERGWREMTPGFWRRGNADPDVYTFSQAVYRQNQIQAEPVRYFRRTLP